MDALIAIAMLCQTTASGVNRNLTDTHDFQLTCQKEYIDCYYGKLTARNVTSPQRLLKDCVIDRKVDLGVLKK